MYRIGFVIEQALGHITHGQNLQANVAQDPAVSAQWVLPSWEAGGLAGFIPNWTFRASWQARQGIAAMQRRAPLDALFFHTQVTAVLANNWVKRIPSIISLDATPRQYDELGEFYAHEPGPAWLEEFKWKLNRNCFQAAKHIVAWSEWAKQGLIAEYGVPADKVTVIPPGVNVPDWRPTQPRTTTDGLVKILFVGGSLERKGGLLLLEAFQALRRVGDGGKGNGRVSPQIELHLVTKDSLPPEPGLFVYNDMQPNSAALKKLYHQSDIFCLPTYGDCLPMVLSEAAAAGLPAISTRVAAIPEITRDGETGFIVPTGDVAALKAALQQLISRPELRQQQGQQAANLVQQQFNARRNAEKLLTLLKQVAGKA